MMRLLIVASLVAFAVSCVLAGTDAARTRARRLSKQHQALLQDFSTDSLNLLTDTNAALDILQTIARRSTEDVQFLTEALKQQRLADERRLQEEYESLKAEHFVLRQRWLRAKRCLKKYKRKAEAASQVSVQHPQAQASETLATMQEVEHRGQQQNLDHRTRQTLPRRLASWWQRFEATWTRLQDVVTADDETGEVMMTDGVVSGEGEANEEAAFVEHSETVGGDAEEEPGVADSFVAFEDGGKDSTQEGDALGINGKRANDEATTLLHTTPGGVPPSLVDNSSAAPRSQELPRRRRRFMVFSFAVLSYAFLALRIYARFRRRQDRQRRKFR